jgi:hypothetical protein
MSAKVIKVLREDYPPLRFVGKCYTDRDRDPETGFFAPRWADWYNNGWFDAIVQHAPSAPEHGDATVALMGMGENGFEYWIGRFFPENTAAPEGFASVDVPASAAGVCWIHGTEPEIYTQHDACAAELLAEGICLPPPDTARRWFGFERYTRPRYMEPDADGNVILDYGIFLA